MGLAHRNDRDPCLLDLQHFDPQSRLSAPLSELVGRLAVAVGGLEPIEIDVIHLVERIFWPIVHLAEVPIDEPVQIDLPLRDSQQRHVLGHINRRVQLTKRLAELGDREQRLPRLLESEIGKLFTNPIITELSQWTLARINIERKHATRLQMLAECEQGVPRGGGMVQHAFRQDEVEGDLGERQRQQIGLQKRSLPSATLKVVRGDVNGPRDIDADKMHAIDHLSEQERRRQPGTASGVKDDGRAAEPLPVFRAVPFAVARNQPFLCELLHNGGVVSVLLCPFKSKCVAGLLLARFQDACVAEQPILHHKAAPMGARGPALNRKCRPKQLLEPGHCMLAASRSTTRYTSTVVIRLCRGNASVQSARRSATGNLRPRAPGLSLYTPRRVNVCVPGRPAMPLSCSAAKISSREWREYPPSTSVTYACQAWPQSCGVRGGRSQEMPARAAW